MNIFGRKYEFLFENIIAEIEIFSRNCHFYPKLPDIAEITRFGRIFSFGMVSVISLCRIQFRPKLYKLLRSHTSQNELRHANWGMLWWILLVLVPYHPSVFVFCLPPASNLLALTPAAIRKPERRSPDGKREGEASVVAVKRGRGTKGVQYAYCSLPRPTGKAEGVTYTASVCKFACFNLCLWRRWCFDNRIWRSGSTPRR